MNNKPIALTQVEIMEALTLGIPLYTHPHPDNLGLAVSIIKQQQLKIDNLYENNARLDAEIDALKAHPAKELHLSLQKSKQTGELLAVTYTDDEHRIVEVLWQRPPVKELTDEEIEDIASNLVGGGKSYNILFARAILKRAQEK